MKVLPLTSESACSSWWGFAQGGGGALLLVLLKVDSADLYRETMTLYVIFIYRFRDSVSY